MNKPYIIGISGGSGSGKTSFIRAIRQCFSTNQVCILSQDDYYRPKEQQQIDEEGVINFDLPSSIDAQALREDILQLSRNESVSRSEYTFNNTSAKANVLHFYPAPIILVEGLFIFHYKAIMPLLDLKIFIDAKDVLKVTRRIKRDKIDRNYPLEDVLYRYQHHVTPSYEQYIQPYLEECDLIVNNNASFQGGLEVLTGFIHQKLKEVEGLST